MHLFNDKLPKKNTPTLYTYTNICRCYVVVCALGRVLRGVGIGLSFIYILWFLEDGIWTWDQRGRFLLFTSRLLCKASDCCVDIICQRASACQGKGKAGGGVMD